MMKDLLLSNEDMEAALLVGALQVFQFPAQLAVFVGACLHPVVKQEHCRVTV